MDVKSFNELKKNSKRDVTGLPQIRVALLGEGATQLLTQAVKGYGVAYGYDLDILEADYNQLDMLLLNPDSAVYACKPDYVVLQLSTDKLVAAYQATPDADRDSFYAAVMERIDGFIANINAGSDARIILFNYLDYDDAVFGNFAAKLATSFIYQVRRINLLLMERAQAHSNLHILDVNMIQARLGRAAVRDAKLYINASMSYGMEAIPLIAKNLADMLVAAEGRFAKCLVLDLDNTLWGGVIGDDGMEGIQLGDLGIGQAFTDLQRWIVQLKERGIILAVCSKNTESVALEPFAKHPDMVLRPADISVFVANWENKVDNIRHIQTLLNIGFDSMVFLDDNPFERNLIRQAIPEIQVPELPEDPAEFLPFLTSQNLFETASHVREDSNKASQYRAEARRSAVKKSYANLDDYLKGLEMVAEAQDFNSFNMPRVAQLTQRSNQFNLRTQRYAEADIERFANSNNHVGLGITLADNYGEHGLISVIIVELRGEAAFIDTWLMSCRVLQRGVEQLALNVIVEKTRARGVKTLLGEYLPTAKNAMVAAHYENLGFANIDGQWVLNIAEYEPRQSHISLRAPTITS